MVLFIVWDGRGETFTAISERLDPIIYGLLKTENVIQWKYMCNNKTFMSINTNGEQKVELYFYVIAVLD
jgi:hypothetical protein